MKKILIKTFFWILVGTFSLGQLQRIELSGNFSGINFYVHEILLALWLINIFIFNGKKFLEYIAQVITKNKYLKYFILVTTISFLINLIVEFDLIAVLYASRLIMYVLFASSTSFLLSKNKINKTYFHFQLFSIGIFSLFLGFLQYLFIKDTRFLLIFGWDNHYARLIGTYFDPGFTGIILILTLILGLSHKYLQNRLVQLTMILIFSWGIILTFSRASYISLAASLIIFSFFYLKKYFNAKFVLVIPIVVMASLIAIAPKPFGEGVDLLRTASISARILNIKEQLQTVTPKTILIGDGLFFKRNVFEYQTKNYLISLPSHSRIPDNIFVTIFVSTGIIGFLLFVVNIFLLVKKLKSANIFAFTGLLSLLIHAQFNNSILQPFVLLLFMLALTVQTKD